MTTTKRLSAETQTRWRVALLGPCGGSRTMLKAAVIHAGGQVVVEALPRADSVALVTRAAADVLVLQPGREDGQHPDLLPFTSAGRPVVLFTHDTSRPLLRLAARSGVAAFLVEPLPPAQVAPTLDLAIARFGDSEVLRRKLAERKLIERAKGRLMAATPMSEEDAFRWLRTRAMDTRSRLADVARAVLDSGSTMPSPVGALNRLETVASRPQRGPAPSLLERRLP